MVVKHKIKMDLAELSHLPEVNVVHRDQNSRQLVLQLFAGGEPWEIPQGVSVIIRYVREDGTGGSYDTLPDGAKAWTAENNILTLMLPPQLLEVCGPVMLAADLLQGESKLSTFRIVMFVRDTISNAEGLSGDYFRISRFLPYPEYAKAGQMLLVEAVDEKGNITAVQAVDVPDSAASIEEALRQARESGEFKGESAYELAVANGFEGTEAEWLASLNRPASGSWGRVVAQNINVTGKLTADGGITVNFVANRLQGVLNPVNNRDAANKQYVDETVRGYTVPAYWQTAVEEAVTKINAAQDAGGRDCFTFAWFSDLHRNPDSPTPNPGHTGNLAAAVMDACQIPCAILCGDGASMDETLTVSRESALQSLKAAWNDLRPIGAERLLWAQGAYDGAWGDGFTGQMNSKELYNSIFRPQTVDRCRHFGADGSCFFTDYPASKVRVIVLNSCWVADDTDETGAALYSRVSDFGFGNAQLNWLANTALHFEEPDWSVVLVSHVPPNHASLRDRTVLQGILSAFVNGTSYSGSYGTAGEWNYVTVTVSYSDKTRGEVAGWFAGCTHADSLDTTTLPYPVVTITSDADLSSDESEPARTMGTNTEHAMDFVTVNRSGKTVSLTRLGVGSDRSFSY